MLLARFPVQEYIQTFLSLLGFFTASLVSVCISHTAYFTAPSVQARFPAPSVGGQIGGFVGVDSAGDGGAAGAVRVTLPGRFCTDGGRILRIAWSRMAIFLRGEGLAYLFPRSQHSHGEVPRGPAAQRTPIARHPRLAMLKHRRNRLLRRPPSQSCQKKKASPAETDGKRNVDLSGGRIKPFAAVRGTESRNLSTIQGG